LIISFLNLKSNYTYKNTEQETKISKKACNFGNNRGVESFFA